MILTRTTVVLLACLVAAGWTLGQETSSVVFSDMAAEAGVDFVHSHGGSGNYYSVETMGSGVALADLDGDGWLDIYFAQNAPTPEFVPTRPMVNPMFRNRGDGTFQDITELSGTADDSYSMGAAAGDYDNDGFLDLYVTNFGPNKLFRNNGDGTFSDVTAQADVADDMWGGSLGVGRHRYRRRPRSVRRQLRQLHLGDEQVLWRPRARPPGLLSSRCLRRRARPDLPQ